MQTGLIRIGRGQLLTALRLFFDQLLQAGLEICNLRFGCRFFVLQRANLRLCICDAGCVFQRLGQKQGQLRFQLRDLPFRLGLFTQKRRHLRFEI